MVDSFHCPKCSRLLRASGELSIDDQTFPVFQCDECLEAVEMMGVPVDVALTFYVDGNGRPQTLDPQSI